MIYGIAQAATDKDRIRILPVLRALNGMEQAYTCGMFQRINALADDIFDVGGVRSHMV